MASPFLYLLLLLCKCCSIAFAIAGHENFVLVSTTSLEPEDVCSASTDSGTNPTALPSTIYKALRSAFRAAMAAYPLVPNGHLDTCYNFTGHGNVSVPRVALTFSGGATIDLDVPNGVLSGGCLAFDDAGYEQTLGVIGNVNQRTLEVMYDVGGGKVGFRAGAC